MCGWIYAVFTSAFCWATADTLFDVILPSKTALPTSTKQIDHLTHAQTMLLCAITTYIIIFLYLLFISYNDLQYLMYVDGKSLLFLTVNYSTIMLLITSGVFSYYHYHYIIKAFEYSSSTVILPFLQFSSIFAFMLSIIEKLIVSKPYLNNPLHLLAYVMILIGGLTPATDGHLLRIVSKEFWQQQFVRYALLADMAHAVYTVVVSFVGNEDSGTTFNIYANMEFFLLTRVMFVVMFLIILSRDKSIQQDCLQIIDKPMSLLISTMLAEVMTLIGYFSSVYAYQCYYQPGVVSASESSLNLIFNLVMAYVLKKYFNIGKSASLQNIGLKVAACALISVGLVIASN